MNSRGESFLEERMYLVFGIWVTAEKDGHMQNAYESMGGITGTDPVPKMTLS